MRRGSGAVLCGFFVALLVGGPAKSQYEAAIALQLDDDGVVLLNDRRVEDAALVRALRKEKARAGAGGVLLPEDLPIETLMRIGGLINEAELKMFYIDSEGERKEVRWDMADP